MSSEAYKAWRAKHVADGCEVVPVCALFQGGPTRWAAIEAFGTNRGREVSAFVTVPLNPELEKEVPIRSRVAR